MGIIFALIMFSINSDNCTNRNQFQCKNGHCINSLYLCDDNDDCEDCSDEYCGGYTYYNEYSMYGMYFFGSFVCLFFSRLCYIA